MKKRELGVLVVATLFAVVSCKSTQQGQGNRNNERNGERQGRPTVEELFEKMDADEDGQLSKEEVKGPLLEMFDDIDTDEDGYLSEEEINNAPKPSRQQGGMQRGGGPR